MMEIMDKCQNGADNLAEDTSNTSKFIWPIRPKIWNIVERELHWASVVHAFCHQHSKLRTVLLSDTDKGPQRQNTAAQRAAGQFLTETMANLHHKLPFIERYSRPEAGFLPFLTMLGAHRGSLRSLSSSRVRCVL